MSADEHEAGHADCALVIAEVWTLLGEERAPEYLVERVRLQISRTTIIRRPGV